MLKVAFETGMIDDIVKVWITNRENGYRYLCNIDSAGNLMFSLINESDDIREKVPTFVLPENMTKEFIEAFILGAKKWLNFEVESEFFLKGVLQEKDKLIEYVKSNNDKLIGFIMQQAKVNKNES